MTTATLATPLRRQPPDAREEELADVLHLLLDHRADDREETFVLAREIATACLGENHLWQDLGLSDRGALCELLRRHFPALSAKNTGNMRWKKFFYKQLCEREGLNLCRAPSCGVCCDYRNCFGPETPDVRAWRTRS